MVRILYRAILDTEIIDHKTEMCFPAVIRSEAECVLHWMIPAWIHMFYQFLVCDDASLFEAINTLFDAHVDPPLVVHQCLEVISVNDLLRDDSKRNPHS